MSRKSILTVLCIFLSTIGFSQKAIINGTIINNKFKNVELISATDKSLPALAKTDIQTDKFTLAAEIGTTDLFFLKMGDQGQNDVFLICLAPKENIQITIDGNNLKRVVSVSGSASMSFAKKLTDIMMSKQKYLDSINSLLQHDKKQLAYSGFATQFIKYQQVNKEWDDNIHSAIIWNDSLLSCMNQETVSNGNLIKKNVSTFLTSTIKCMKLLKNYYASYQNYIDNIASSLSISTDPIEDQDSFNHDVAEFVRLMDLHHQWVQINMQEYASKIDALTTQYDELFYDNQLETSKAKVSFANSILAVIQQYSAKISADKTTFIEQSNQLTELGGQINNNAKTKIQQIVSNYQQIYDKENRNQNEAMRNLMIENKHNLAALMFLDNFAQDKALVAEVINGLNETYPNHPIVSERYKSISSPQYRTSEGSPAPELAFPGVDGKIRKLSDLRGKVVLIDFWASWCGPCRRENPHVVREYAKYHSKGFEIFSVSLDKTKQNWTDAIAKDNLSWPNHVSDLKGWGSEAAKIYGVNSIPATFLIDQEGNIIAKNLRGEALSNALKQIFGE